MKTTTEYFSGGISLDIEILKEWKGEPFYDRRKRLRHAKYRQIRVLAVHFSRPCKNEDAWKRSVGNVTVECWMSVEGQQGYWHGSPSTKVPE